MAQNRVEILKNLVAQNPGDTFSRYGLAMEYSKAGDFEGAMAEFRELLEKNPEYAAAYFHGAQTLEKMGRLDEARDLYRKGIEVTTRTGDTHTRSELEAALEALD